MRRCQVVVVLSFALSCARPTQPSASAPEQITAAPANTAEATPSGVPTRASEHEGEHVHASFVVRPWTLSKLAEGAKLLGDMGKVQRTVTTRSSESQAYFNQGLALTYGFNHDEAARSFAKATQLDPSCAMCFWGAAYTLGPNYNMPLLPDRAQAAWDAINTAQELSRNAAPVEQALIGALAKRYKGPEYLEPPAMQPYNEAYAHAMREVAKRFPEDLDVQTLYAEAMMNVNPWKLWSHDGDPAVGTDEIVKALELVLARDPMHAGANHYYIHAVEASKHPARALPSADRLAKLVPGAGHMVHMPAHIYQRVGRYADASEANRRAIITDQNYLEKVTPPGYYPFYVAHNYGFLAYSASMEGRSEESLAAARKSAHMMPKDLVCGMPGMDFFTAEPLLVMVRFGRWDELLQERAPDDDHLVMTALYHHAQGMALAAKGRLDEAKQRHQTVRKMAENVPDEVVAGLNSGQLVLELAAKVLEARIAELEKRPDAAARWYEAVVLEDKLAYNEPADWFYPTRQYYGAVLLDARNAREAEAVYRKDLENNPNNGWSLFGLYKALEMRGQRGEAKRVKKQFDQAWKNADIELARSAL